MNTVINFRTFFTAAVAAVSLTALLTLPACDRQFDAVNPVQKQSVRLEIPKTQKNITAPTTTTSVENVTFTNANNLTLTAKLYLPARPAGEAVPTMVILHGCGGLWSNDDVASNTMVTHFNEWAATLQNLGIATLFVDSFTPRNEVEFCGQVPPQDAKLSPAYERPFDAYAALAYLRTRPEIEGTRIGLMGFSHGGGTTVSAMVNTNLVAKSSWSVIYNKVTYTVPGPVARPAQGGFKTAIAYYPGAGFFSYYGSISDHTKGKYINYAPLLILIGANDDLVPATQVQYNRAVYNGAGSSIQMEIYPNANHSFDEAKSTADGDDWTAKQQARTRTLNWIQATL